VLFPYLSGALSVYAVINVTGYLSYPDGTFASAEDSPV
jgi:uncharacterized protein (DUF952 family)